MQTYKEYIRGLMGKPTMVAHRGAWYRAPENSLSSIEKAYLDGHRIVEIDLQRSSDGEIFVFHDLMLERMTVRTGRADELPISSLTELYLKDLNGGPKAALSDQRIPTLREALNMGRGRVYFDLDIKYEDLFNPTAEIVAEMAMQKQVSMKGPAHDHIAMFRLNEISEATGIMMMPLMQFTEATVENTIALVEEFRPSMIEIEVFDSLETVAQAKRRLPAGTILWVNTLDEVANLTYSDSNALRDPRLVWGELFKVGVDVIQTDAMKEFMTFTDELAA